MYVGPVKLQGFQDVITSQKLVRTTELLSVQILKSESSECLWYSNLKVGKFHTVELMPKFKLDKQNKEEREKKK